MNRKLILYIAILVLIIVGAYLFLQPNNATPQPSPFTQPIQAESATTVEIDYADGETVSTDVDLSEPQTAISALEYLTGKNDIELETTQYDFGVLVDSIGGKQNTDKMAWIYFVNGESASVGADQYELKPGDTILWKYTEPTY